MATNLGPSRGVMYFDCCINSNARSLVIRSLVISSLVITSLVNQFAADLFLHFTLTRVNTLVAVIMDGTTEPIIVVIGHPIAGNPSQFALERALRAMKLDWRVLSFDVKPEDVAAALEGFSVTGIAGVLIDPSVAAPASQWYADRTSSDFAIIDCLCRDDEQTAAWQFRTTSLGG